MHDTGSMKGVLDSVEFPLNVFTEFAEFSDKNIIS